MTILEIKNLESGYGEVQILWGVDLKLEEGKLTSLVGTNGAGKTTMLRTVMGTIKPWDGTVHLNGKDVSNLPAYRKPDLGIVLVPEGRQLFTSMSVEENLEMGATNSRARSRSESNLERVYSLFPRLKERRNQQSGTLSGGEQQMLAVARGLMADPQVIMFDELSLGLAPVLVLNLFQTLRQLKAEGLTMLLVEQNVHLALSVSDYAYVLSEGRITLEGPADEVASDESVQEAYLGI
ncbi:MAG: ABC transporter ATP-binding protein [Anaerolineales bacterium]|jgi:branched-chain amino acid transport system ATP-binding protein